MNDLPPKFFSALGEILTHCIYETASGRYICRLCDTDVTVTYKKHEPDCEFKYIYTWMTERMKDDRVTT